MKITKKWVLQQASEFWKQFGHLTFFKTKKQYLNQVVLPNFKAYKQQQQEFLVKQQRRVLEDLGVRETQARNYLKVKNDSTKLDILIKSKVVK